MLANLRGITHIRAGTEWEFVSFAAIWELIYFVSELPVAFGATAVFCPSCVGFFGRAGRYNKSFSVLIPVWGVRKKNVMFKRVFPPLHVRGQAHLQKSGAGAKRDCFRRLRWSKLPAEKENQRNMITTNISSDAPRTGHTEWNIVLFLALHTRRKQSKWWFNFARYACAFWDRRSLLKTQ